MEPLTLVIQMKGKINITTVQHAPYFAETNEIFKDIHAV